VCALWLLDRYGFGHKTSVFQAKFGVRYLFGISGAYLENYRAPPAALPARVYKSDVNALANLTFLTQETNLLVSDRDPAEYLEAFACKYPGAVASHWISMDRDLWAAKAFLDGLLAGAVPERETYPSVLEVG
jgi:hypothetical protein